MDRWTEGRVSLLGDACHATLPFLAQGAAMAMEDGVVLARALQVNADPHAGLKQYEQTRRERTGRVVAGSAENTKRFHNPRLAEASGAQEYVDREWSEARIKERYEWLFTYDATRAGLA